MVPNVIIKVVLRKGLAQERFLAASLDKVNMKVNEV
jgi:hypothetical protein